MTSHYDNPMEFFRHVNATRCNSRRWPLLALLATLSVPLVASHPAKTARAVEIGRKPELFLHDDYLIERRSGVTLVPGTVKKYEKNPVLVLDQPWEKDYLMTGCSVIHDIEEGVYKMWYEVRNTLATDPDLKDGQTGRCLYAISNDGLNWEKPILNAINWKGSTENNVVFIGPDNKRTKGYWVMKDYSDPDPEKRYKMLFHFWDFRGRGVSIATSPDGIRWTARPYNNLLGGFDTLNVMLYDDRIGAFTAYLRKWVGTRRHVSRAVSHNGFHWSNPVTVLGPNERDPSSVDIYAGGVFKQRSASDAYVMLAVTFDRKDDTSVTQLAISRDGIDWHRFTTPLIPLGQKGEWDSGLTWGIAADVTIRGETAFYYRGNTMAHGKPGQRGKTGIGVAMLRPLGFSGWHAQAEGVITTQPLLVNHARNSFHINMDTQSGSVEVELLNERGEVIPGFSRRDCEPIRKSGQRLPVRWKSPAGLSDQLRKGAVRLRIYLNAATVYGIGCAEHALED